MSDDVRRRFLEEQGRAGKLEMRLSAAVLVPPQGFCPGIGCMDEGASKIKSAPPAVRLAGSGALLHHHLDASQEAMVKIMDEHDLGYISWHKDCGAGAVLAEQLGRPAAEGDQMIKGFAESVAKVSGAEVVQSPLYRPPHQHVAVCHYYTGTRIAPHLGGLPAGFVTSHFVLEGIDADYGKHELAMAAGIAFGPHGFGDLFTEDTPYTIVVIAVNQPQLTQYLAEVREVIADLPDDIRKRVALRAFIGREPVKL